MSDANPANRFALGVETPRFTWAPGHTDSDQKHVAHQIVVTKTHAQHGQPAGAIVWDSGRVESSIPEDVYAGPALWVRSNVHADLVCYAHGHHAALLCSQLLLAIKL